MGKSMVSGSDFQKTNPANVDLSGELWCEVAITPAP
jgi:hypothetical protein